MTIREFVKRSIEYDHYRKRGTWGKYTVYYVWNKAWEGPKSAILILPWLTVKTFAWQITTRP